MVNNAEIESLKAIEKEASKRKQRVYNDYLDAKKKVTEAYDAVQIAWKYRCIAHQRLEHEFRVVKKTSEAYRNGQASVISLKKYHKAKMIFQEADATYQSAEERYNKCKEERDYHKALFDFLQDEHTHLRIELDKLMQKT